MYLKQGVAAPTNEKQSYWTESWKHAKYTADLELVEVTPTTRLRTMGKLEELL